MTRLSKLIEIANAVGEGKEDPHELADRVDCSGKDDVMKRIYLSLEAETTPEAISELRKLLKGCFEGRAVEITEQYAGDSYLLLGSILDQIDSLNLEQV